VCEAAAVGSGFSRIWVAPVKAVLEYKTYSRSDAAVPFREFFVEPAKINAAVKATFEQSGR
jgi:hypothetical protein